MPTPIPLATLDKEPGEARRLFFDFGGEVDPSGSITAPSFAISGTDGALTYSAPQIFDLRASALFSGGTEGVTYKIVCTITTGDGQTLHCPGYLKVGTYS